jgi:hypothetical protein
MMCSLLVACHYYFSLVLNNLQLFFYNCEISDTIWMVQALLYSLEHNTISSI